MRALKLVVFEGLAAFLVFAAIGCSHQPGSTTAQAQAEITSPPAQVSSATSAAAPDLVNSATATPCPPSNQKIPIKHVFLIVLENKSFERTFADDSKLRQISKQGVLLTNYWGIGHNSMDNYIAMISGQAPNPATQMDCPVYVEVKDKKDFKRDLDQDLHELKGKLREKIRRRFGLTIDPDDEEKHREAVAETSELLSDSGTKSAEIKSSVRPDPKIRLQPGIGCIYKIQMPTIADQLETKTPTHGWRAYMEGMPGNCDHPEVGDADVTTLPSWLNRNPNHYTPRHNPFVYFRSLIGTGKNPHGTCNEYDVPLGPFDSTHPGLLHDLVNNNIASFVFISPDLCNDGHTDCSNGAADIRNAEMERIDSFVEKWVRAIMQSRAYNDGGLIIITFDEAEVPNTWRHNPKDEVPADTQADKDYTDRCCNEKPGPGRENPGLEGPGGGKVGAILISPYIKRNSPNNDNEYNHYSMLRSIEDFFDLDHLGYAAQDGLNTFQACGVFNKMPRTSE